MVNKEAEQLRRKVAALEAELKRRAQRTNNEDLLGPIGEEFKTFETGAVDAMRERARRPLTLVEKQWKERGLEVRTEDTWVDSTRQEMERDAARPKAKTRRRPDHSGLERYL